MIIEAKILADSINPAGDRITTWELTHPRYIHAETLRHRMLAFNAASSRAIPIERMIDSVLTNPAAFEQYGAANKGMSAQSIVEDRGLIAEFLSDWTDLSQAACGFADRWKDQFAKQIVNRALEPWAHMTVICTATDWSNFYALRAHPAAQPEFQVLAYRMLDAYLRNPPIERNWGEWHLPLVYKEDFDQFSGMDLVKVSSGRCARVSYNRHQENGQGHKDIERTKGLIENFHMSPTEHPAQAIPAWDASTGLYSTDYHGCFKGWKPYRKFLPSENRTNVDLAALLAAKPDWITL